MEKEGVVVGDVFTLDHLKHFIKEADEYTSLTAEVDTADVGKNTLKNFIIVNRKLFNSLETPFHWENVFGCGQEHVLKIVYLLAKVG